MSASLNAAWSRWLGVNRFDRRLFLILLVGLLPLGFLSFVALLRNAQAQKESILEAAENTMRAVVTAVDAEHRESLASLDALASSPRLNTNDLAAFHEEALELLGRRPEWKNIILVEASGTQVMNARVSHGAPLPDDLDHEFVKRAIDGGKPGVGGVVFRQGLRVHSFPVYVPVRHGGAATHLLIAMVWPEAILDLVRHQRLPENGVVGVFDAAYKVVARTLDSRESVGRLASPGLQNLLTLGREGGWSESETLEGTPVYAVYFRSAATGWSAAVGIPKKVIDGAVGQAYAVLGGAFLFSALLGLAAALLLGQTFTRSMKALEAAAVAVGQGRPPAVPNSDLPEVRQIAQALSDAHVERDKLLQREREARLEEQAARLIAEEASRAKDEFLAMLGHELRNPLAAITTALRVLEDKRTASGIAGQDARAIVQRQVANLARLTDDLLDAGRVTLGKISLERAPVDLAAAVTEALNALRGAGRMNGLEVHSRLDALWADADPTRLEQIVTNLLSNAAKYTPPPGAIDIRLREEGGLAELRIRDTGVGIAPELLPRIFDLFVQGEPTLDRAKGGLGIGLTLVKRLVEMHGGTIEAQSEGPGKGSEFIVRLPAIAKPAQAPVPDPAPASPERRIVIVEDNTDIRESLRMVLEFEGHQVFEASDGKTGVDLTVRERPQIVFVDVGLPVLDGYQVARAVRERMGDAVCLVAMTGYGSREDVARGKQAGFDHYLVKPVNVKSLLRVIADSVPA